MASFSVDGSLYTDQGFVTISWVGTQAVNHYSWRVYRRDSPTAAWALIRERTDTAANFTFKDYYAPSTTVEYAVVEVTASNNVQTEEAKVPQSVDLTSAYYWLLHPTDTTKHMPLRNVNSDEFTSEREFVVKKLIGRGRKVDVGDNWGRTGSLGFRIYDTPTRTARQIRLDLEAAKDTVTYYFLRTPFGDVWKIWFEDPAFSRIAGHGKSEFMDVSVTYYEVA